ncbi:hypothetical protein VOLCADRAFT_89548 [Volvox carteri f. nagariensis]|uniref:CUE domain-containing protein n=1 Tax=Volvox carteri f. nagariensis TaxID=3068 RepID=D8TS47_VOLCA|nr:uncharacterized protein VOLCADRAFT_89548 [Volvox carteri f. nagariensis]EFJ49762.1 hypothetical protein VOLCADRAFT_89548 [Volvox carteri f. nagariensis]|eukprot:XP_002949269.1 hypothetical protein VOLCADRAFT_89548 [Volvox carteri f. nagariensis]
MPRHLPSVQEHRVTPRERDPGGPPRDQQAQMLYDMWLLDIPKLMDVAVLYGTHNLDLTRKFLCQARRILGHVFELQPRYSDDLAASAPLLVGNLAEVVSRCGVAGDKALKTGSAAAAAHAKELRDAVDYLRDAAVTLTAFVACYSPAAAALLQPDHGALLCTLASAHDRLLPQLARVFSQPGAQTPKQQAAGKAEAGGGGGRDDMGAKLGQVAAGLRRLGYLLLLYGCCGVAAPGSKRQPKPSQQVAELRGNELMSLLMAVSSAGAAPGGEGQDGASGAGGFLGVINQDSRFDAQVASALLEGTIALDDAQFDYLLALVGGDPRVMDRVRTQRRHGEPQAGPHSTGAGAASSSAGAGPSGSSGAGPSGSGGAPGRSDDDAAAALRASLVSQIKELLGDYGDGFLAACLEVLDNSPEKVINALLEDNLPPQVAKLDRKLATWGGTEPKAGAGPSGSGTNSAPQDALAAMSSWNALAGLASASTSSPAAAGPGSAQVAGGGSGSGFWRTAVGGSGSGGSLHRGTLKILDRVDKEVKALTSRLGDELQWEYDDEYDDSFDDLAGGGADGVADAEGDDEDSGAGRRVAAARGAGAAGLGPSRLGGLGRNNLAASTAEYEDEPNDASYSSRGPTGTSNAYRPAPSRGDAGSAASGSSAAGLRGTGRPPATAAAAAAVAAAAAASATTKQDGAPRRAPTMVGHGPTPPPTAGGRTGGRGVGAAAMPVPGGAGRGGRGGRGGERLWVLDGKIYNYAKEGAQMVSSRQEADALMDAARQAAMAIHGLGPGGNKGLMRQQQQQQQQPAADGSDSSEDEGRGAQAAHGRGGGGRGGQGGAGGRGSGEGGGSGDRRQHDRKEKNKAAVANHHRKDRALRKQGLL